MEDSFIQCLISRAKPVDVKAEDMARIRLLDIEVQSSGGLWYLTRPPGDFWMWNMEKCSNEKVKNVIMVLQDITAASLYLPNNVASLLLMPLYWNNSSDTGHEGPPLPLRPFVSLSLRPVVFVHCQDNVTREICDHTAFLSASTSFCCTFIFTRSSEDLQRAPSCLG